MAACVAAIFIWRHESHGIAGVSAALPVRDPPSALVIKVCAETRVGLSTKVRHFSFSPIAVILY